MEKSTAYTCNGITTWSDRHGAMLQLIQWRRQGIKPVVTQETVNGHGGAYVQRVYSVGSAYVITLPYVEP